MSKTKLTKQRDLNGQHTRFLRGLGHHLSPMVHIGKEGVSDSVIKTTMESIISHELIKVKLLNTCPTEIKDAADILCEKTGAVVAQILGKTLLLFKENPKRKSKDKIELPRN